MKDLDEMVNVLQRLVDGDAATLELVKQIRDRHDEDIAKLRDELLAVANRVEALTQATKWNGAPPQGWATAENPYYQGVQRG